MKILQYTALAAILFLGACAEKSPNEKLLSDNAAREGVIVTDSGLQYEILRPADGPKPTLDDMVTVHYRGELADGTVFDSSYDRNEPATFPAGKVIPGWKEGLQLMSVGSKYKFVIPSELGYGEKGVGPIPANSVLVFEVELLEIQGG